MVAFSSSIVSYIPSLLQAATSETARKSSNDRDRPTLMVGGGGAPERCSRARWEVNGHVPGGRKGTSEQEDAVKRQSEAVRGPIERRESRVSQSGKVSLCLCVSSGRSSFFFSSVRRDGQMWVLAPK